MKKKIKEFSMLTFTKKWVSRLLVFSMFCILLTYGLAFYGATDIAETLATTMATEIIAICLGYFLKSFFETKEEEKLKFEKERFEKEKENFQDDENMEDFEE